MNERNELIVSAVKEMLEYIEQERKEDSTIPGIKEIHITEDRFNYDTMVVWAIMQNGKTFKYAWYVGEFGVVADGF